MFAMHDKKYMVAMHYKKTSMFGMHENVTSMYPLHDKKTSKFAMHENVTSMFPLHDKNFHVCHA